MIRQHQIIMSCLDNNIKIRKTNSLIDIKKNKHDREDIARNDKNYREGNFHSKPKKAEESIVPSTINEKRKGEVIYAYIQTENDTIDHQLRKISSALDIRMSLLRRKKKIIIKSNINLNYSIVKLTQSIREATF